MPLERDTVGLLSYLRQNKPTRDRIAAGPDRTMLYAGRFARPAWQELEALRRSRPDLHDWELLPDVLRRLPAPDGDGTLLAHVERLCTRVPWRPDGFVVWRALSGILAGNAVGRVRFYVASEVARADKVLAATELWVLRRNPAVDPLTREVVDYLIDCVQRRQTDINFALT